VRRTGLALALTAVGALWLATGAARAASFAPRLLARYEPVAHFDPHESFMPTRIQSFVADADLERETAPNVWAVVSAHPQPDRLPGPDSGAWRLNQDTCTPNAPIGGLACYAQAYRRGARGGPSVYGRVARADGHIVLQYWFFYYDDVYSYQYPPSDFIWQAHEGDWEVVNVVLSGHGHPESAGYSQHCSGERRAWSRTPRVRGTHPP
jgi:hypothetical protein